MPTILESLIPAERIRVRAVGTHVGVPGGIWQYLAGAAGGNARETLVSVMDYGAAGNVTETTGAMTSGSDQLTVGSATDFAQGNFVKVATPRIETLAITSGATTTGNITLRVRNVAGGYSDLTVAVVSGDSASTVAGKIRVSETASRFHVLTGSGTSVIMTQKDAIENWNAVEVLASGTGVAGSSTINTQAVVAIVSSEILSIAGTTLTLSTNALATVSGAIVSHNDLPAFIAARNATTTGQVLYAPTGEYRWDNLFALGSAFSGKTFRGDGPLLTKIYQHSPNGLNIGESDGASPPDYTPVFVTGGLSEGSQSLSLEGDGLYWQDDLTVGKLIWLHVQNDETLPVFSVYGYDSVSNESAPTNQAVRITGKTVNSSTSMTVAVTPPLLDAYGGGALDIRIRRVPFQANAIGVEGVTVDATPFIAASRGITMGSAFGSWIYDCKTMRVLNYPMEMNCALQCEIRHSHIRGSENNTSNSAGLLFYAHSCLIEDNIMEDTFPVLEMNGGSAGNVFTYNFGPALGAWNTNHGPHNQFNIFEGNAIGHQISDGYFGSDAFLTFYRNYQHDTYGLNFKRYNRMTTIIGNILRREVIPSLAGNPFITSGHVNGSIENSTGDFSRDWHMSATLTTRTDDSNGVLTIDSPGMLFSPGPSNAQTIRLKWGTDFANFVSCQVVSSSPTETSRSSTATILRTGPGGVFLPEQGTVVRVFCGSFYDVSFVDGQPIGSYPERDMDVGNTMRQFGNYDEEAAEMSPLPEDVELIGSIVYDAAPDWWTEGLPWPPYDPTQPEAASVQSVPAGYRYFNGETEPAVATPTHSPSGGSYTSGQNVTISCATPDTVLYYTTDGSTPDNTDAVYSAPVAIGFGTTVLKSIAYNGDEFSAVRTSTYTITEDEEPPIGGRRLTVAGKQLRIGGKVLKIGGN